MAEEVKQRTEEGDGDGGAKEGERREDEPSKASRVSCSFKVNYISEFTRRILGLRWTKEVMLYLTPLSSVLSSPLSSSSRRLYLFLLECPPPPHWNGPG